MNDVERDGHIESVVALVVARDYVSFVEIARHLEERGMATAGDLALCLPEDKNLILWMGMSAAFVAIMHALQREKRIFAHPSEPLVYLIDGAAVRMPVAVRPPKGGYRKPHWIPVAFRTVPLAPKEQERRMRGVK